MAASNSGDELNEDVWVNILKRLPVKTICRFECVYDRFKFELMGVLHGIICLSSIANSTTVLWNPSIHKYTMIPPSPYSSCFEIDTSLGFGFDSLNNDFKVVRNIRLYGSSVTCDVFSFRQGLWRTVVAADLIGSFSPTSTLIPSKPTTLHNRFSHWIVEDCFVTAPMILVFDYERDELKTMDLPPEFDINNGFDPWLSDINYYGMLSVLGMRLLEYGHGQSKPEVVTWVMVEYGVATSWKKLTTVDGRDFVPVTPTKFYPYVFEPSMFLMDENTKAKSYTTSRDRYGKVSYIKDGTQCDYIQVPFT